MYKIYYINLITTKKHTESNMTEILFSSKYTSVIIFKLQIKWF